MDPDAVQIEHAARLGVDRTTLWRWENGRATPRNGVAIASVKRAYGCTQEELNSWFAGEMPPATGRTVYALHCYQFVTEHNLILDRLVERLLAIDAELLPGVDPADAGSCAQWVPLFLESPFTWRMLTHGSEVVGYWQYLCLRAEASGRVKAGQLRDGDITRDMIEFPLPFASRRSYRMYIIMFGIVPAHQNPASETMLLRDFTSELARLAEADVYFSEMAAVAFSAKSAYLCRELGMRSLGAWPHRRNDEIGEIFHIEGQEIATARLIRRDSALAERYRQRFT